MFDLPYQELVRGFVILSTVVVAIVICVHLLQNHNPETFDLRQLFTAVGKDKKQYMSRSALGELVALFATTSGYLGVVTVRPQDYETATLVYGGLWVVRGGYSTYLRSKTK